MKKILAFILIMMMVVCLAVPAHAATPELGVPEMPTLPDLSDDIHIDIGDAVDEWLEENPVPPLVPVDPEEPDSTEPNEEESPVRWCWMDWLRKWIWRMWG